VVWRGDDEHAVLVDSAFSVLNDLEGLPGRLLHGEVHHYIHTELADRARSLALHLSAALTLTRQDYYGPAFALLRTSLEHRLLDSLVFLGRRYVQVFKNVDEEQWKDWVMARDRGEEWTRTIKEWTRTRKGEVKVIREGPYARAEGAEEQEQQAIAVHYLLLREYSPLLGSPREQTVLQGSFATAEERREWAERNRFLYETYLRWRSLKESLQYNGLATEEQLEQYEVHYRFLSAFVHPFTDVLSLVYGRNGSWPTYDHYASELALLYINMLAARELIDFARMAANPPSVPISGWPEIHNRCGLGDRLCRHLWFPGQGPHSYDRWVTANHNGFEILREDFSRRGEVTRPEALEDTEVRYYSNPLQRLVAMHASAHDIITGFVYQSPWPRDDAQFR
jgi:hypothetical protein